MPEDNPLNESLAQALKLLDGEPVVTPEVEPEVKPVVEPVVVPEPAVEPVVEPEPTQEPELEGEPEGDKIPHGESSRLGRKVKRMEDTFAEAMAKLDALTEAIGKTTMVAPVEDEMPEIIATPDDVQKVIDIRDRQRAQQAQKEKTAYFSRFKSHESEDPELYADIYEEMLKNHNDKNTGKPEIDADINYLKAKNAIFSRKLAEAAKPKPNVLSKEPPPANVPKAAPTVVRQINLSADEQAAANAFGFSEDDLQRILSK